MRFRTVVMTMACCQAAAFVPNLREQPSINLFVSSTDDLLGEVTSNEGGKVRGCTLKQVGDSVTDWMVTIDGVEADLGRFSEAIYKKMMNDAKQQRFQGFRPGTVPPHLEPTYRTFTMDECARETVLESMEQNDISPFSDARAEMAIESVSIPPPIKKKPKKKKSKKRKEAVAEIEEEPVQEDPKWQTFDNMKGAIDAGWKPGQSFSFVAKNVKGQKVLSKRAVQSAKSIGRDF